MQAVVSIMRLLLVLYMCLRVAAESSAIVPNQYIVVLESNLSPEERNEHDQSLEAMGVVTLRQLNLTKNFIAYTATVPSTSVSTLSNSPAVRYIESDRYMTYTKTKTVHVMEKAAPSDDVIHPANDDDDDDDFECPVQTNTPSWGLARINKRELENVDGTYYYSESAGDGTRVYVLDTGIYLEHSEFEGRAIWGIDVIYGEESSSHTDMEGHGTHVAGIATGRSVGVAKLATAVAVKILDDNGIGTTSSAIEGLQWVLSNHTERGSSARSVCNLSLGGAYSAALNEAVDSLFVGGVVVVTSAGNDDDDACKYSPASAQYGLDIGATDQEDFRAYYSNYGSCVEMFAPGDFITSSYIGSAYMYAILSGTSMASPHVAGVCAVQWTENPDTMAAGIREAVVTLATADAISDAGSESNNLLLWSDYQCSGEGNYTDFNDKIFDDSAPFDVVLAIILAAVCALLGIACVGWSLKETEHDKENILLPLTNVQGVPRDTVNAYQTMTD